MSDQAWRESPSETRPFKSYYGGGFVPAANFLAEGMCARIAKLRKKDLPHKFWNLPEWKRLYLLQLRFANSLLQLYDAQIVLTVLKQNKRIFSLNNKMVLDPLLEAEAARVKMRDEIKQERPQQPLQPIPAEPVAPRPIYTHGKSTLNKLRELDG